jgi:NNP family nitrate/nitrite transporter-like MFS transporter
MLMFGVVWVSLMWMYWTEVRPMDAKRERDRARTADLME